MRDRRHFTAADEVAAEAFLHLREATNRGRVRPTLTVFADRPQRPGPWINLADVYRYDLVPVVAERLGSTRPGSGRCGGTGSWSS